ncbi:MAG: amino acid permease [Sphingomonadaceae bacterium]|jgi:GABA permease|nr:amino acid permease [Sphingomonadaceae bacterium]NBU78180.1 amino acid permease [Sphingomonadaceae bacterium]NCA00717.1 amino acid permease [Sphingomonadaceae bacterium]
MAKSGLVDRVDPVPTQELSRSLKARHVSMITFGGIIGAGLFVGSSTAISAIGPAAVLSYALAGFLVLLVMRMISEMAMALPGLQTFPDFARAGVGNWAGFLVGWLYWYFWVVVIAIEAIAGAKIIHGWLPQYEVWEIGVTLMAVLTGINLMSARSYGEFEFWFASTKVVAILVFILVAAAYAFGLTSPTGPTFSNLTAHGGFAPAGIAAIFAGVATTIFSLCGAEIATLAAAESDEGKQTIARMTISVSVRILVFFVLSILMIVSVVPWTDIEVGVSPFAHALRVMGYPSADLIMNAIVLVAVLSCLNSGIYITSRAMFGLAQNGDAPQSCVVLSRSRVPARAILIASLFSYGALAASVLAPDRVFNFLVTSSGAIMLFIYLIIAFAQLRLRARFEAEDPSALHIRMWLYPYGTWAAMAGMAGVLLLMGLSDVHASELWASVLVATGFLLAYAVKKRAQA